MSPDALPEYPWERLLKFGDINPEELAIIARLAGEPFQLAPRSIIRRQGDPVDTLYLLHDGWVASSTLRRNGGRLIMKVHVPGDFLGGPSLALTHAAETLSTFTRATLSKLPLGALTVIFTEAPRLAAVLFLHTQLERVTLSERLASIGRSSAESRLAALLMHLYDRLGLNLGRDNGRLYLPLTQADLGDVLGLTQVHVNRTMKSLEERGLIARPVNQVHLLDPEGLRALAGTERHRIVHSPGWLPPHRDPAVGPAGG